MKIGHIPSVRQTKPWKTLRFAVKWSHLIVSRDSTYCGPMPIRYPTPQVVDLEAHWQQMDLFLWKDQEKRMDHFGNHDDDDDV